MTQEQELKAKDLVNKIYQPLGKLHCEVSSNEMWEYAKEKAIENVDEMINELQGHSDLYGYYQDNERRWSVIERIIYWQGVKTSINNL